MNSRQKVRTGQHFYVVTVLSNILINGSCPERIELTFTAQQPGSADKVWRVEHELTDNLFVPVTTAEQSADIVASLHEGDVVTLPNFYTSFQLVELGFRVFYRKRSSKSDEKKRWEPNDYKSFE